MKQEKFPTVPDSPKIRLTGGFRVVAQESFGAELISIGRSIGGDGIDESTAYSLAIAGGCHCGRCRGYGHCAYSSPRHIGDVVANVFGTGVKSGALTAYASRAYGNHQPTDVVVDLGIGAGACTAGWDLERGAIECGPRLGVEVEPQSLRLAHVVHETLVSAPDIGELAIPDDGSLVVLSGLVFNVVGHSIAESWAAAIAKSRDEFVWVDVSYQPRRHSRPDHIFENLAVT
jgi:hypothetical protein